MDVYIPHTHCGKTHKTDEKLRIESDRRASSSPSQIKNLIIELPSLLAPKQQFQQEGWLLRRR